MLKNKKMVSVVSDMADASIFVQDNSDESIYYNGELLGDFNPNNSINQLDMLGYTLKKSNIQSAIETLHNTSKIPIDGIYTSMVLNDPNKIGLSQKDTIKLIFADDVLKCENDVTINIYGVLFDILKDQTIDDIHATLEHVTTGLFASKLFETVSISVDNTDPAKPILKIDVIHFGTGIKYPGYSEIDDNGNATNTNKNARTFGNIFVEGIITQQSTANSLIGYGKWEYIGKETKTLTNGSINAPIFFYYKRTA